MRSVICPESTARRTPWLLDQARQLLAGRRLLEAARVYAEVLGRETDCVEALGELGSLFYQFGQHEAALSSLQRAAQLAPGAPKLHLLMGAALKSLGRMEESAACCKQEIRLFPDDADARYNLGLVLQTLKRPAEAVEAFQQAVRLRPGYVDAWMTMGLALRQAGEHEAALEIFERVIQLDPNHAAGHFELATILLLLGRFERGWREYEWRWKLNDPTKSKPNFKQPLWDGKDLGGRRILLRCEQGFGDTIQFCRYARLVADLHGEVILGCPAELQPLMVSVPGVTQVVTSSLNHPDFDTYAPLPSLPWLLGTRLDTIPCEIPYLRAPTRAAGAPPWVKPSPAFKVGVAWAVSGKNLDGRLRSLPLEMLAPLLDLPGLKWYSLQCGDPVEELKGGQVAGRITNLGARFNNFGDTAQAVHDLDLIISVDTVVAHVAGALGRRVWTLVPWESDARWMIRRDDSPWYPTMRLFRQTRQGDWAGVVTRVGAALASLSLPSASHAAE